MQQLRGKKLGITAYGALAEILARQILIAHKVPADQVTFLPMGTSDVTYLALKAGTIDATMLQIPQNFLAEDEGFRKLASGADVYRAVQGGLTTTRATISDRPELVTKMIRATQRSLRLIRNDKKYALEFIKGPTSIWVRTVTVSPNGFTKRLCSTICNQGSWMKNSNAK